MNRRRKGLYSNVNEQLRDLIAAQGRARCQIVVAGDHAIDPVGEPIPGTSSEDKAAAAARLAINSATTK